MSGHGLPSALPDQETRTRGGHWAPDRPLQPPTSGRPAPSSQTPLQPQTPPHCSQAYYLQKPDVCKIFLQLITQLTAQMTEEGKLSSGGETLHSQTAFLTGSLVHDTSIVSYTFYLCCLHKWAVHKLHYRFLLFFGCESSPISSNIP